MGRQPKANNDFLTDLELSLMNIIWREGPSTVHDVQVHLKHQKTYAYTTISTILRVLKQKNFLSTTSFGAAHIYRAEIKKEDYNLRVLNSIIEDLFSGSPILLIQQLIDSNKLNNTELDKVQEMIKRKKM